VGACHGARHLAARLRDTARARPAHGWATAPRPTPLIQRLSASPSTDATASAARYGSAELRASEQQREQQRQERVAELRRRFVDGPVVLIPGGGGGSYDTRGAVVIPDVGTVYFGAVRFSGDWGTLEAEKGVLVASDGGSRRVSGPVRRDEVTFTGDGLTFKAAQGSVVREGARRGDYESRSAAAVTSEALLSCPNRETATSCRQLLECLAP
jgi:hypothetical protein